MVATAPKKSNTLLLVVVILVVLGLLTLGGGFIFLKVVPSLILNKLTGTTQINPNQNLLEKLFGGLTGGNNGGTGGGLFDGGGGGGLNPGGTGGTGQSEDELALQQCTPGKSAYGFGIGAGWAYTGKEKFAIDGKSIELCCLAVYDVTQGQVLANAEDKMCGDGQDTLVYTHKIDGKFVPYMAGYKKDGKDCVQNYDEAGSPITNYCSE